MINNDYRLALCKKLVRNDARSVLADIEKYKDAPNRILDYNGNCLGHYEILDDYDEVTDTFGIGYQKRIPANSVGDVVVFNVCYKLRECLINGTPFK